MKYTSILSKFAKCGIVAALFMTSVPHVLFAQDTTDKIAEERVTREGAWELVTSPGRSTLWRRTVYLAPKSETKPALSVQFFPNDFHSKPGNAAIYYLQAGGFFENTPALQAIMNFEQEAKKKSIDGSFAPYVWLTTELNDIPVDELRNYLRFSSFQTRYLEEAASRRVCDFDRQIQTVSNPIGYLLPEIQGMREIARIQALRFLLAIAEDRTEDAIKIMGQLLAMGRHLSQEPFLVSSLVGNSCANIGLDRAYYLSESAQAPNLYWAIASLPSPLIDMSTSMSYERELLFAQVNKLREIGETPMPEGYWKNFVDSFLYDMKDADEYFKKWHSIGSAGFSLAIAADVPKAREYLQNVEGVSKESLKAMANVQIFFLAMRRFYERYRDEAFKTQFLPVSSKVTVAWDEEESTNLAVKKYGLFTYPTAIFLPTVQGVVNASLLTEQQLALWRIVESIRHHLATNGGELPGSLEELELPAPNDPATNRPFSYATHANGATLKGAPISSLQYQIELRSNSPRP